VTGSVALDRAVYCNAYVDLYSVRTGYVGVSDGEFAKPSHSVVSNMTHCGLPDENLRGSQSS